MDDCWSYMQACFDDGGKGDASLTCVAGYFIRDSELVPFKTAWHNLLGMRRFHMVDLVHGLGDFADLAGGDRAELIKSLIAAIKQHIYLGVVVSVERTAYDEVINNDQGVTLRTNGIDLKKTIGSPFSMCAMLSIAIGNRWMEDRDLPREETTYYFESGNCKQGEADNFLKTISKQSSLDVRYNYVAHGFVKKNRLALLDAADLLNWEWTQHCKRLMGEENRPERESLKSLCEVPHVGEHFTRKNIRLAIARRLIENFVVPRF
jgi:hypothetical protein